MSYRIYSSELFTRPDDATEPPATAKRDGEVKFVGFTVYKDLELDMTMLRTGLPFDAVWCRPMPWTQLPLLTASSSDWSEATSKEAA